MIDPGLVTPVRYCPQSDSLYSAHLNSLVFYGSFL